MGTGECNAGGNPTMGKHPIQCVCGGGGGGSRNTPGCFMLLKVG